MHAKQSQRIEEDRQNARENTVGCRKNDTDRLRLQLRDVREIFGQVLVDALTEGGCRPLLLLRRDPHRDDVVRVHLVFVHASVVHGCACYSSVSSHAA